MDWAWSTAGNMTLGDNGIETTTLADGTVVRSYDYMKGHFVWQKSVRPSYAWYDGNVERMTMTDSFASGMGSQSEPVQLGRVTASKASAGAKIFPFKVMVGRQPGHLTADYLIVPKLFGPGGFWGAIPSADNYTPEAVRQLWTQALTAGARAAGQIAAEASIADGDWGWLHTRMAIGIKHEH